MKSNVIDVERGSLQDYIGQKSLNPFIDKEKVLQGSWLPLSQIEVEETGIGGIATVALPEWLATEKGLT